MKTSVPLIDSDDDTECILIIVDMPMTRNDEKLARYETSTLGIIMAKNAIVTLSSRDIAALRPFRNNQIRDFRTNYRTRFTLQLMYEGSKQYLRTLSTIDHSIEEAELRLNKSVSNKDLFTPHAAGQDACLLFHVAEIQPDGAGTAEPQPLDQAV